MQATKRWILGAVVVIFVVVAMVIIMNGRPVAQMNQEQAADTSTDVADEATTQDDDGDGDETSETEADDDGDDATTATTDTGEGTSANDGVYTMADVAAHATASDCWSAVNGSVYDLSTWVSRHPGGPEGIIALCGADGSARFNAKHGSFPQAQSALVLLKIGTLE